MIIILDTLKASIQPVFLCRLTHFMKKLLGSAAAACSRLVQQAEKRRRLVQQAQKRRRLVQQAEKRRTSLSAALPLRGSVGLHVQRRRHRFLG